MNQYLGITQTSQSVDGVGLLCDMVQYLAWIPSFGGISSTINTDRNVDVKSLDNRPLGRPKFRC